MTWWERVRNRLAAALAVQGIAPGKPGDGLAPMGHSMWETLDKSWGEQVQELADVREAWRYTAMIMQPDIVTPEVFEEGRAQLLAKHPGPGPARLRLEPFHEGRAIQVMHLGPYATEMATIARMDEFAQANGLTLHGRHHEIYLGDPRRADPEKLKTVLRHPVV